MGMEAVPKYTELIEPLWAALQKLGGSGSNEEIDDQVSELLNLSEEILNVPHNPERSSATEFQYQMAWARTYLKKYGWIENSSRAVWSIVPSKTNIEKVDAQKILRTVREADRAQRLLRNQEGERHEDDEDIPEEIPSWRESLHHVLTEEVDAKGFERLIQRLLRESGFVNVVVTGRPNDKGIDGKGIVRINGLLSFHVMFQCKKYQGTVVASEVRDFRGALIGRADKGLLITTGRFTKGAKEEAMREGAPPIDLIDGDDLADMLKELGLGIRTEFVEHIEIDEKWYQSI